ncbi:MAG TPA: hypothetical protein VMI73_26635 [Trebonia sp.]|nr:hypothetical protein [Trebonia sp.]
MNRKLLGRSILTGVRNHPWWTAAVTVPVVAASVLTGTTMASARPQPTLAVSASALRAAPKQHIMSFGSGGKKVYTRGHSKSVAESWHADGCDHDYGAPNQCVPWSIPGATPQAKCAWLKSNGFGALKVYRTNRQQLPEDGAGYVCGTSA